MSDCRTIMITSFKGGVGKSTITANTAMMLAQMGKRVLCVDCDFRMRSLDLIMGMESRVVYDVCDLAAGSVPPEKAVVHAENQDGLMLLAAPYRYRENLTAQSFGEAIDRCREALEPDFILLDTPGDNGEPLRIAASCAELALIIATHQPASIRAAEQTGMQLEEMGVSQSRLLINCFQPQAVKKGLRPGIIEMIDRTCVRLIGVICEDDALSALQENGFLIDHLRRRGRSCDTVQAFDNLARRLCGEQVPLFWGFRGRWKNTVLTR